MQNTSALVDSPQASSHLHLDQYVNRHLNRPFRREPSRFGREAFARVAGHLATHPFILDAGCGTGASTFELARRFPQHRVLGVDKSLARLARGQRDLDVGGTPENALLVRLELVDFWQLAAAAGLRCEAQFLLYPNPWPKPAHLMRRWHGHPVWPAMLALGGAIELRTNWRVYADEFARALALSGRQPVLERFAVAEGGSLSPFEKKYAASGHALWRCRA